ncbi:MAG: hypothetical protein ABI318_13510, partial [Chthoniobacteraceae bacterium]
FWMMDCNGVLSVARIVKEKGADKILEPLKAPLGGCNGPGIPVEIAGTLGSVSLLLPTPEDRAEFTLGLKRDYVFIAAYTLGYLSLMGLLRFRAGGIPGRNLAHAAFLLTIATMACDIGENKYTERVLPRLHGDYGSDADPAQRAVVTPAQEKDAGTDIWKKQWCSYGKWTANSALCMVLAFVFLRQGSLWKLVACCVLVGCGLLAREYSSIASVYWPAKIIQGALLIRIFARWRHPWQILAGGLLFAGGLFGFILGGIRPMFIEYSFTAALIGSLIGTVILLGIKSPADLWEQPQE